MKAVYQLPTYNPIVFHYPYLVQLLIYEDGSGINGYTRASGFTMFSPWPGSSAYQREVHWLPSHSGVLGSEAADLAAKKVTGGTKKGPQISPSDTPLSLQTLASA